MGDDTELGARVGERVVVAFAWDEVGGEGVAEGGVGEVVICPLDDEDYQGCGESEDCGVVSWKRETERETVFYRSEKGEKEKRIRGKGDRHKMRLERLVKPRRRESDLRGLWTVEKGEREGFALSDGDMVFDVDFDFSWRRVVVVAIFWTISMDGS